MNEKAVDSRKPTKFHLSLRELTATLITSHSVKNLLKMFLSFLKLHSTRSRKNRLFFCTNTSEAFAYICTIILTFFFLLQVFNLFRQIKVADISERVRDFHSTETESFLFAIPLCLGTTSFSSFRLHSSTQNKPNTNCWMLLVPLTHIRSILLGEKNFENSTTTST